MHIRPPHIRLLHPYQACVHGRVRARRRGARYAGMRVLRLHRAAPLQAVPVAPLCRCVRALVRVRGECVCILRLRVCMRTMNAHTAQSCCRAGAEHPHFSPPHRYYSTVRLVAQHLASCGFLCVSYGIGHLEELAGAPVAAGRARTPSSRRRRADTMEALARPSAAGGRAAAASCWAAAVPRHSPPSSSTHDQVVERLCSWGM